VSAGQAASPVAVPRAITDALAPLPEAHLVTDLGGTIGFASPAARRLLDPADGELTGHPLADLLEEPPLLAPLLGRWSRTSSMRPAPLRLVDGRQLRCDGARLSGHPFLLLRVRDRGDALTPFERVNDRVETANLRALSERLEASVAELRESNLQLSAATEEVQQYARAVAHDVRTPLFTIQAFARLLAEDGHVDDAGAEHVRSILDSTGRLQGITDALLEVARLERTSPSGGRSQLAVTLDDVLADLAAELDPVSVTVAAGPLHAVAVERTALHRVLQNLVVNAVRHGAVADRPLRISVTSRRVGSRVTVAVRDDGVGIDEADRDRLFELFQRGPRAAEIPGTGIGLAASRKIVTAWGGTITCEPVPDTGSCFVFTAPASHGSPTRSARAAPLDPDPAPTG
jgi:signal transduction histidine kinase